MLASLALSANETAVYTASNTAAITICLTNTTTENIDVTVKINNLDFLLITLNPKETFQISQLTLSPNDTISALASAEGVNCFIFGLEGGA